MLKDCKARERFEGTVLVNEWKEVPFRQKQGTYLVLTCQDRSGTIQGKIFLFSFELNSRGFKNLYFKSEILH